MRSWILKICTKKINSWIGFLIGIAIAFVLIDCRVLDPENINWLLSQRDSATHFLGWHFYRNQPLQIPLGFIHDYGMDLNGNLVFTDSIPLLAYIFRLFSFLLPDHFQYWGWWIYLCFGMQSWLIWKLLYLKHQRIVDLFLATALLSLCPFWLYRLLGQFTGNPLLSGAFHLTLIAQWLILAALYLYFTAFNNSHRLNWSLLVLGSSLIHAYFLVMVLAIYVADRAQRLLQGKNYNAIIIDTISNILLLIFVMYTAGYFTQSSGYDNEGWGYFSANLAAPLITMGVSNFIPSLPMRFYQHEGFSYVGIGIMLLFIINFAKSYNKNMIEPTKEKIFLMPLLINLGALWVFAVSSKVSLFSWILIDFDVSNNFVAVLRSSGRFIWPILYLAMITATWRFFRVISKADAKYIMSALLILQVADISNFLFLIRQGFEENMRWETPLQSTFWDAAMTHYDAVIMLPRVKSMPLDENYLKILPVAFLASEHHKAINVAYYGRGNGSFHDGYEKILSENRSLNFFSPGSPYLYVINDRGLFESLTDSLTEIDGFGVVDNQMVIAPGWFAQTLVAETPLQRGKLPVAN